MLANHSLRFADRSGSGSLTSRSGIYHYRSAFGQDQLGLPLMWKCANFSHQQAVFARSLDGHLRRLFVDLCRVNDEFERVGIVMFLHQLEIDEPFWHSLRMRCHRSCFPRIPPVGSWPDDFRLANHLLGGKECSLEAAIRYSTGES